MAKHKKCKNWYVIVRWACPYCLAVNDTKEYLHHITGNPGEHVKCPKCDKKAILGV